MKTILLPTDFSENSKHAMEYALRMVEDQKCRIIVVNAFLVPHAGAGMMINIEDKVKQTAEWEMANFKEELGAHFFTGMYNIETYCEYGDMLDVMNRACERYDVDLIVMGTKGASGIKEALIGSNTAAVLSNVRTPTLTIPEDARFHRIENITLAADLHDKEDGTSLEILRWLASICGSKVNIVHVNPPGSSMNSEEAIAGLQLHHQLEGITHEYSLMESDDPIAAIDQFVHEKKQDMLAVTAKTHGFIERVFHKSVTRKLCMHTDVPMLTMHG